MMNTPRLPVFVLPALLLLFTLSTAAQTEKGRIGIGGAFDMSSAMQGDVRRFNMSLNPSFGIFVVKNFLVGGRYSFGVNSNRSFSTKSNRYVTTTSFTTGIGPLLKYYVGKKALRGVFAASGAYTVFTQLSPGGGVSNKNGFTFGGSAGMAYFLNPHISLEGGMYINTSGFEGDLPTTRVGFSIGFSTFLNKKPAE